MTPAFPAGFNAKDGPAGVTFSGRAFSEPLLNRLRVRVRAGDAHRFPPASTPALSVGTLWSVGINRTSRASRLADAPGSLSEPIVALLERFHGQREPGVRRVRTPVFEGVSQALSTRARSAATALWSAGETTRSAESRHALGRDRQFCHGEFHTCAINAGRFIECWATTSSARLPLRASQRIDSNRARSAQFVGGAFFCPASVWSGIAFARPSRPRGLVSDDRHRPLLQRPP